MAGSWILIVRGPELRNLLPEIIKRKRLQMIDDSKPGLSNSDHHGGVT